MLTRLGDLYALLLGWPWLARLHRALFYLSARALGLHNYRSAAISGEHWIVRQRLAGAGPVVVFDVGANEGEWSALVRQVNPQAQVHAFEPQAALAAQVAASQAGVRVVNAAVGERPGRLALHDYAGHAGSQHASLLAGVIDAVHGGTPRQTEVPVITLDDHCAEHGIMHIDFLKIDVEGFELPVLRGAARLLKERRIDTIQFEFNEMNVLGRAFLHDFAACLGETHDLHRLLPHGLMPLRAGQHWISEQFIFQNIIASRKSA